MSDLKVFIKSELENFPFKMEEREIGTLESIISSSELDPPDALNEFISFIYNSKLNDKKTVSMEHINQFSAFLLSKKVAPSPSISKKLPIPVFDAKSIKKLAVSNMNSNTFNNDINEDELSHIYGVTPKCNVSSSTPISRRTALTIADPKTPISPSSFALNPENEFQSPQLSKNMPLSWGNSIYTADACENTSNLKINYMIKKPEDNETTNLMFQKLSDSINYLNESMISVANDIKNDIEDLKSFHKLGIVSHSDVFVFGRIFLQPNRNACSLKSVHLDGDLEISDGIRVNLEISNIPSFSLFSGQVAVFRGTHPSPSLFVASEIFANTRFIDNSEHGLTPKINTLRGLIFSGPYFSNEKVENDFVNKIIEIIDMERPLVIILMGPFLNRQNLELSNLSISFDSFVLDILTRIHDHCQNIGVSLFVVPSIDDITSIPSFPQPPFLSSKSQINVVPNPTVFSIGPFVFGISTLDVCLHMSYSEIGKGQNNSGRICRILTHILNHKNFYPIYPPSTDSCIDYNRLSKMGLIDREPDVLIFSSTLCPFIKRIRKTVCVNSSSFYKSYPQSNYLRFSLSNNKNMEIDEDSSIIQTVKY